MVKPFIFIEADKQRRLRFNSRAIISLENIFKMGAFKYFQSFQEKALDIHFDELITLFWLSLLHEDKDLSKDDTYEIFDLAIEKNGFEDTAYAVFEALASYFGIDLDGGNTNVDDIKKKKTKKK